VKGAGRMYRKEYPDSDSGEMEYREFKMIIDSSKGKYEFMIAENGLCRNAYESRTQANMNNNRGSFFMVIPFIRK
jgi:hypothetical protein